MVPDAAPSGEVHGAFVLMNDIHGLKQAQEALRASEAELRLIMDNVPARVSYIDRDYRYRFLNRHNEEWLGESRKELTGRQIADVVGNQPRELLYPGRAAERALGNFQVSEGMFVNYLCDEPTLLRLIERYQALVTQVAPARLEVICAGACEPLPFDYARAERLASAGSFPAA